MLRAYLTLTSSALFSASSMTANNSRTVSYGRSHSGVERGFPRTTFTVVGLTTSGEQKHNNWSR